MDMYEPTTGCTNQRCDAIATIFTAEKFCENFINEDDFNNTFVFKMFFLTAAAERNYDKVNKKRCESVIYSGDKI